MPEAPPAVAPSLRPAVIPPLSNWELLVLGPVLALEHAAIVRYTAAYEALLKRCVRRLPALEAAARTPRHKKTPILSALAQADRFRREIRAHDTFFVAVSRQSVRVEGAVRRVIASLTLIHPENYLTTPVRSGVPEVNPVSHSATVFVQAILFVEAVSGRSDALDRRGDSRFVPIVAELGNRRL